MYISMSISQVEQGVGHAGMREAKVTPTNLTGLPYLCSCGHSLPPRQPCWGLPCTCQVLAMDQVPMEYHPEGFFPLLEHPGDNIHASLSFHFGLSTSRDVFASEPCPMVWHFLSIVPAPIVQPLAWGGEGILCQQGSYCTSVCDAVLGAGRVKNFFTILH